MNTDPHQWIRDAGADPRHYVAPRYSGIPLGYFRRRPLITWDRVLVVLACLVIVWAMVPWGHV